MWDCGQFGGAVFDGSGAGGVCVCVCVCVHNSKNE